MNKQYKVDIAFRRGPAFGTTVKADNKEHAIGKALQFARLNGFDALVKKSQVREVPA